MPRRQNSGRGGEYECAGGAACFGLGDPSADSYAADESAGAGGGAAGGESESDARALRAGVGGELCWLDRVEMGDWEGGGGGRQREGVGHWASALFGIGKTEGEKGYLRGVILALAFALQALALDCV